MNTDLQDALIAWQGGELPAGRTDALLERLRVDAGFRQTLAQELWTLSLTKVAQSPDPRWLALHEEIGLIEKNFTVMEGGFEESLMQNVRREPLRFVNAWWRWAATAAAAAVVVLSITLLFQNDEGPTETLAVLVNGSADQPSRTVGAGPLHIEQGQARLLFTNGVIMDIKAPADLRLLSVSRVICREGKLRTNVPKGAEGFCVETPRGAVTDLGTELGISVSREGKTDVAVFEGEAELSALIPGGQGMRTALLQVNERAGFQSSTGEIRASEATGFIERLQPPSPALTLPQDYAQRVLAAKPLHYWRLDRSDGAAIPNEVEGGPTLLMELGADIEPDAHGRVSARLHGAERPGVLYLDKSWRAPVEGYAIEFWFMPDTVELMALGSLTTTEYKRPHVSLIELGGRRPGDSAGVGSLRYLLRWPPGHRDGMNLYSAAAMALPYQWHHLVAQQSEGRMQLFLNGKLIGPAQADTLPKNVECLLQFGALEYRPGQGSPLRRPYSGRIAEVAVYERVLSADEIADHATTR